MIKLQHIDHFYGDKQVLKDLSLEIEEHAVTCLLGSSGCGKTTLLRLIAGLEIPSKGKISIANKLVSEQGTSLVSPEKREVGFVFQDLALWPHFSVYKNIAFALEERKTDALKEKVEDILQFFGIEDLQSNYPHQLSGGQQQLVAIARALVLKPKVLLMDEPMANLDIKLKRKLLTLIVDLKKQFDISIVYVTHNHKEAFAIADNIVILNNGSIEAYGSKEVIQSSKNKYVKYFIEY
jgi:ABC-type Fe3+/spermidine/putrescine transport system ATPase subunit